MLRGSVVYHGMASRLHLRFWTPFVKRRRHRTFERRTVRFHRNRATLRVRTLWSRLLHRIIRRKRRQNTRIFGWGSGNIHLPSVHIKNFEISRISRHVLSHRTEKILQELPNHPQPSWRRCVLPPSGLKMSALPADKNSCCQSHVDQHEVDNDEFIAAVSSTEACRDFVKRRRGCRMLLAWPRNYVLRIHTEADLRLPVGETRRLSDNYLCCFEELTVLGGVGRLGTNADLLENIGIVFVGENSRIYMYPVDGDDAMYLLGDNAGGFLKRGLKRYYPIYREISPEGCVIGFLEMVVPGCVDTIMRFAMSHPGTVFALPWPRDAWIKIITPRRRRFATRTGLVSMIYFGAVVGRNLDPIYRELLIAVDSHGTVFAYNPWDDVLARLCWSISELFSLGLRAVRKTYRFRARLSPAVGDRPPQCPHIRPVVLPVANYGGEDSVLRCLCRAFSLLGGGGLTKGGVCDGRTEIQ
nr:protein m25.1 [Mastomys natalensis cytomegalovirus 3]WEG70277.1 protein m25.1 [Mastomys natalensis cytomegalovirus 3]WEG70417.1 protein m25.1 [Mastomys natalensis cytomegalovirus 3]WEG70557.1 protein m25.1 [Mastomys natalensis cytomegalovirus 3]WEG70837.1 protein m25.1 [Mastomys natalensis cytomegalovirus 3]